MEKCSCVGPAGVSVPSHGMLDVAISMDTEHMYKWTYT
jgi:hypothetical protein